MKDKCRERKAVGTIEGESDEEEHGRHGDDDEQRVIERVEKNEERRSHTDHPEELPPGERTGDLVFDIDELRNAEHHIF